MNVAMCGATAVCGGFWLNFDDRNVFMSFVCVSGRFLGCTVVINSNLLKA